MNFYYNYKVFLEKMCEFKMQVEKMNQEDESNKKLFNALKDTIDFHGSLNKLNQEERDKYLQILCVALNGSFIQK